MRIENDVKLDFSDVLIRPKRSTLRSRREVDLIRNYTFRNSQVRWSGVPVIAANMDTTGTFAMARELARDRMLTALHKHYDSDAWREFVKSGSFQPELMMPSIGANEEELDLIEELSGMQETRLMFLCIDVANGYGEYLVEFVRAVRKRYPDLTLIAGNVVTGEMTEELLLSGADIVKVGIGSGAACTTRVQTGVGYPQLSAVIECADAAHGLKGHIISDGGCAVPGDVAKAFAAGADFVMLGGLFAGHDESGGEIIDERYATSRLVPVEGENGDVRWEPEIEVRRFKSFYGMSSTTAMDRYHGGVAEYRSSEGRTVRVPYRGAVRGTIQSILGGLRSACTYVGAERLKELSKRTTFIPVNRQVNNPFGGSG